MGKVKGIHFEITLQHLDIFDQVGYLDQNGRLYLSQEFKHDGPISFAPYNESTPIIEIITDVIKKDEQNHMYDEMNCLVINPATAMKMLEQRIIYSSQFRNCEETEIDPSRIIITDKTSVPAIKIDNTLIEGRVYTIIILEECVLGVISMLTAGINQIMGTNKM